MQIEIKVGRKWKIADATIDKNGWARVKLTHPYGIEVFKTWRKPVKEKAT